MNLRILLPALLSVSLYTDAPQTTVISIDSDILQSNVKRLGLNLGTQTHYDSGQLAGDLLLRNPGFEGAIFQSIIRCGSGTASACTDEAQGGAWPDGFWNGGQYEVIWGAAKGRSGEISNSTTNINARTTVTFADSGKAPAAGDYLVLRKTTSGGAEQGWWPGTEGGATITTETADLPPDTDGTQCIRLSALGNGQQASLRSYFDSTPGITFLQLNGSFRLAFRAKGAGGVGRLGVSIVRLSNPARTYASRTIPLVDQWSDYSVDFSASEAGDAVGSVQVAFYTEGQSAVLLDDVSLTQTDGEPTNTTAFRDAVVKAIRVYNPGILRYWAGQLGETLDNQIAPPFARKRSQFSRWVDSAESVQYGLHEFLQLCETTGAEPWYVVPITFSTREMANLIEYLAGPADTPYGARRAARGHARPWTEVFSKIHLEFGNESWNSTFSGGTIDQPAPYGNRASEIFAAARGAAAFVPSRFNLVIGGQAAFIGRNQEIAAAASNYDSLTVAPYLMDQVDTYDSVESLFGPLFAQTEQTSKAGAMRQNSDTAKRAGRAVSIYEVNLHTTSGAISQAALDSFTPSAGAGLAVGVHMLTMLRDLGARDQMLFALPQYTYGRADNKTAKLWGAVVDMGATDRKRPQFLTLQLLNEVMGGDMIRTTHGGADPTWHQPLVNGVQLDHAHYLRSFAFAQSSSARSVVLFNLHRTEALPVSFAGINAPRGRVVLRRIAPGLITDDNESAVKVSIEGQVLEAVAPGAVMSLPPFSVTVLTWQKAQKATNYDQ